MICYFRYLHNIINAILLNEFLHVADINYFTTGLPFENEDLAPAAVQMTDLMLLPVTSASRDGHLVGWNVYCKRDGNLDLQIWRPTGETNTYTLLSSNHHAASVGQNQVFLENVDRVWMMRGDVIGLQQGNDIVAYVIPDPCTSSVLTSDTTSAASETLVFKNSGECHHFSLQTITLGRGKTVRHLII